MALAQTSVATYPLEGRDLHSISRDEIIASILTAPRIRWSKKGASRIARVTSTAVVKWGRHIHLSEAQSMQDVAEHTSIRIPAVIDAWEADDKSDDDESNTYYILMEYVAGKVVLDIWDTLYEQARRNIHAQLYDYLCQLQALQFDTPGPLSRGICNGVLFTAYGAGPFESVKELETWHNDRILVCHNYGCATHILPGSFSGSWT